MTVQSDYAKIYRNNNNMARIQNSYAQSPTDPLAALVNTTTGAPIPNLPPDSASIARMNGNELCSYFYIYR